MIECVGLTLSNRFALRVTSYKRGYYTDNNRIISPQKFDSCGYMLLRIFEFVILYSQTFNLCINR